jgi:hypothetical protein
MIDEVALRKDFLRELVFPCKLSFQLPFYSLLSGADAMGPFEVQYQRTKCHPTVKIDDVSSCGNVASNGKIISG